MRDPAGIDPVPLELPDGRIWLRVADPAWDDPLDDRWAQRLGGRWNPPGSHRTLYLNADVATARLQVQAMLDGFPVDPEDLADDAYVLVAATLPRSQTAADALSAEGLRALDLPATYPVGEGGNRAPRETCQRIGRLVKDRGLRGVACRSAASRDGRGRELAWFPATVRSRAHPVWPEPRRYGAWRSAAGWEELGLEGQPEVGGG